MKYPNKLLLSKTGIIISSESPLFLEGRSIYDYTDMAEESYADVVGRVARQEKPIRVEYGLMMGNKYIHKVADVSFVFDKFISIVSWKSETKERLINFGIVKALLCRQEYIMGGGNNKGRFL